MYPWIGIVTQIFQMIGPHAVDYRGQRLERPAPKRDTGKERNPGNLADQGKAIGRIVHQHAGRYKQTLTVPVLRWPSAPSEGDQRAKRQLTYVQHARSSLRDRVRPPRERSAIARSGR